MVIKLLGYLFLIIPFFCQAQKQGNIWYFGKQAGVDFNTNPPTPLLNGQTYFYPFGWNEGSSTISDSSGNLLFYTNGMKIWNKLQQVMPNGDSLMGNASSTQSSIIVPLPGSNQFFYVFTTDAQENNYQNGLRYNVVDICLDSGLGDVMSNQKNIKLVDTVAEKLISIRHSNGTDYWIVTHKFNTDAFYSFRLTSTGIVDTVISSTGTIDLNGVGQMIASPNGQKIAYAISTIQPSSKNFLVDFDVSTGIVSNEQILSSGGRVYGLSFSPDNSKLYCSANGIGEVYQYDLNAGSLAAIIASKTYIIQNGPDSWRQMQLGPDGKIYISRTGKEYLAAIQSPNNLCPSCNYTDSAIYLGGKFASAGLPNFITAYNYSNTIYDCEAGIEEYDEENDILIYPNPTSGQFQITNDGSASLTTGLLRITNVSIYNLLGEMVLDLPVNKLTNQPINLSSQPDGIYFVRLQTEQGMVSKKVVVMR